MADVKFDIGRTTRECYELFNKIRDKERSEFIGITPFWDAVVLTASDEEQKRAFEAQISGKLDRREIPRGVAYHVFADPPGPRIGCGGATMRAIGELNALYSPAELKKKFILLINAGGLSQRLPSSSVLGKVFAPLPISGGDKGRANWQVLELKLACYLPLLARMSPGYLHVPSDTIEVFDMTGCQHKGDTTSDQSGDPDWTDWNFSRPGLSALAHPSSVEIGRGHGVFVLHPGGSGEDSRGAMKLSQFCECREVLQKPTEAEMRDKMAVISTKSAMFPQGVGLLPRFSEFVYTDSLFYFDHSFAEQLHSFYVDISPIPCELDAYGDFMRSMGPNADPSFTKVSDPVMAKTRSQLFKHLQNGGLPLNVIAVNASKFYHLGTMTEYLDNLCADQELEGFIGFDSIVFSHVSHILVNKEVSDDDTQSICSSSRIIHSLLGSSTSLGSGSVVEYCRLDCVGKIDIGEACILSNCAIDKTYSGTINIPHKTFICTIPVKTNERGYVALDFSIRDDIKKTGSADSLLYHGGLLREYLQLLGFGKKVKVFSSGQADENSEKGSLWDARIFPVMRSMHDAFLFASSLANGVMPDWFRDETMARQYFSASDAMKYKDAEAMLAYRNDLADDIRTALDKLCS